MSRDNDSLKENTKKRKITATDDYAPIDDDKINNDQYAPPEDDASMTYYDDNTYGGEVQPSSLPSNAPYAEPTGFPTKKPRTEEPTSVPTIMNNDDEEVEVRTSAPTSIPTYFSGQPTQQPISNRRVGWTNGDTGATVGGFFGILLLIPVVRFFVRKFTNPSVGVAQPDRNEKDDVEAPKVEIVKKPGKVSPFNIDGELEVQKTNEQLKKDVLYETIPAPDKRTNSRNSRKVIPLGKIEEEKPTSHQKKELDHSDEVRNKSETVEGLPHKLKPNKVILDPIRDTTIDPTIDLGKKGRKPPSSKRVSNLVTTPVIDKGHVLGGGKEDY
jgi:hypothetical protein